MNPTRREICEAGLLGVVALVLGGCDGSVSPSRSGEVATRIPPGAPSLAPDALSFTSFSPHVGTMFHLASANGDATALRLVAADDSSAPMASDGEPTESFVLTFAAESGTPLEQGTYAASHAELGSFPLFIVPGPSAVRQKYSAVFNRI